MATQVPNKFTSYNLSDEEIKVATNFPTLTLQFLYTLRSGFAESRLNLTVNAESPVEFIQQEAYLAGQIEVLTYLIDCAESAQQEVTQDQQG